MQEKHIPSNIVPCLKGAWDADEAIKLGKALTRAGHHVIWPQLAILDGKKVIVGYMTMLRIWEMVPYRWQSLDTIQCYWPYPGGLGEGWNDLVPWVPIKEWNWKEIRKIQKRKVKTAPYREWVTDQSKKRKKVNRTE